MDILTNQEFTYRQVPVSAYTGTLDSIKGNTLVWNQLVQNGNFASTTGWGQGGARSTLTVSNNVGTATLVNSLSTTYQNYSSVQFVAGHKVFVHYEFKVPRTTSTLFACENNKTASQYKFGVMTNVPANIWQSVDAFHTVVDGGTETLTLCYFTTTIDGYELGDQYQIKNAWCVDLTKMFGAGKEPSTVEEFTSLFPLSYYSYNTGELVSFRGTGLKTTGKNVYDFSLGYSASGSNVAIALNDGVFNVKCTSAGTYKGIRWDFYLNKGDYVFSLNAQIVSGYNAIEIFDMSSGSVRLARLNENTTSGQKELAFSLSNQAQVRIIVYCNYTTSGTGESNLSNLQVEFGSMATSYEAYTEKMTSLPISTYYPTGMKSAGSVYDELTESKAITRIGAVDLGTLTWSYGSDAGHLRFYSNIISGIQAPSSGDVVANVKCSNYEAVTEGQVYNNTKQGACITSTGRVVIYDPAYTDAATFTTAMDGVYLYYELATPTETDVSLSLTYNIEPNGTEEIYPTALYNGWVDMGSLTWTDNGAVGDYREYLATISGKANGTTNMYCEDYQVANIGGVGGLNIIRGRSANSSISVVSAQPTATDFKNSMDGVMLYYEKSDKTPYTSPILADITYRDLIPVSVIASPNGSGTVTGSGMYRYKQSVTLTATPNNEIYRFLRYEDENGTSVSTSSTYTFVVGD